MFSKAKYAIVLLKNFALFSNKKNNTAKQDGWLRRSSETRFSEAIWHQETGHQTPKESALAASRPPRQKRFHEKASETENMYLFLDSKKEQSKQG